MKEIKLGNPNQDLTPVRHKTGEKFWVVETKQHIEITPEWMMAADNAIERLKSAWVGQSITLLEIERFGYWKRWGFDSMKDFIYEGLNQWIGATQAYKYLSVAKAFESELRAQLESGDSDDQAVISLPTMSVSKLAELAKLPEKLRNELMAGQEVISEVDGQAYSIADIEMMTVQQVKDFKEVISGQKKKVNELTSENETLKAELQAYEDSKSNDASVAGELALTNKKLRERLDKMKGELKRGDDARTTCTEAGALMNNALTMLTPQIPKTAEDFVEFAVEGGEAMAVLSRVKGRIDSLITAFHNAEMAARGE